MLGKLADLDYKALNGDHEWKVLNQITKHSDEF